MKKQLLFLVAVLSALCNQNLLTNNVKSQAKQPHFYDYSILPDPSDLRTKYRDPKLNHQRFKEPLDEYNERKRRENEHRRNEKYKGYAFDAGIVALSVAAIWGVETLWNFYTGIFYQLKNKVNHIDKGITNLISYQNKHNKNNALSFLDDESQITFITKNNQQKTLSLQEAQLFFRALKDEIHLQESQQKKK